MRIFDSNTARQAREQLLDAYEDALEKGIVLHPNKSLDDQLRKYNDMARNNHVIVWTNFIAQIAIAFVLTTVAIFFWSQR